MNRKEQLELVSTITVFVLFDVCNILLIKQTQHFSNIICKIPCAYSQCNDLDRKNDSIKKARQCPAFFMRDVRSVVKV